MQRRITMKGFLHVYYGNGVGKTTAAVGLAIRAAGANKRVLLSRFMKSDSSSELAILKTIPNITIMKNTKVFGYYYSMSKEEKNMAYEYYNTQLHTACTTAINGHYDLLILDELLCVYSYPLIDQEYFIKFIQNPPQNLDILITGKTPVPEIISCADYISETKKIRHPYDNGVLPREGIEY